MRVIARMICVLAVAAAAGVAAEKTIFFGYSLSYAAILAPDAIVATSSNTHATFGFNAFAGATFLRWVDVYAGANLFYFFQTNNAENFHTMLPLYAGVRMNLMPDWPVYPAAYANVGYCIANHHAKWGMTNERDSGYSGVSMDFGGELNWRYVENSILFLRAGYGIFPKMLDAYGDFGVFAVGIGWKNYF